MISNATQMIRVTRGRGLVISSEATRALVCRAPADIVNLAIIWGLGQDRAVEAVGREVRNVVVQAEMKRRSFRGVIDVVDGGQPPVKLPEVFHGQKSKQVNAKRKADTLEDGGAETSILPKSLSKREQKRQAKKAKFEARSIPQQVRNTGT